MSAARDADFVERLARRGQVAGSVRRTRVFAVVDAGAMSLSCMILERRPAGEQGWPFRVLGAAITESRGFEQGAPTDLAAAEQAVRRALASAERMAETTVKRAVMTVGAAALSSRRVDVETRIDGQEVRVSDVARAHALGRKACAESGRVAVHGEPCDYVVDGRAGVRDPTGMFASKIGVRLHVVSTAENVARTLSSVAERAHLELGALVAAPYASALAVLEPDEAELGAVVIDMGAAATQFAVFAEGAFQFCGSAPVGGRHVTKDLALGLSMPVAAAERLKTLHGAAFPDAAAAERDMIASVDVDDGAGGVAVTRSLLAGVIGPRMEETFEMVRDQLHGMGGAARQVGRVVLTGGASRLAGAPELARRILDRRVRVGRPRLLPGAPEIVRDPSFAAAVGAALAAACGAPQPARRGGATAAGVEDAGVLALWRWLKRSF